MKDPDYCFGNGALVSIEILEWLSAHEAQGKFPTTAEVKIAVVEMVESYNDHYYQVY